MDSLPLFLECSTWHPPAVQHVAPACSAARGTRVHVEEFGTTTFGFFSDTGTSADSSQAAYIDSPRALGESLSLRRSTWIPPRSSLMMSQCVS
jgi:hypothetical protein